jgi:hypothetical protein
LKIQDLDWVSAADGRTRNPHYLVPKGGLLHASLGGCASYMVSEQAAAQHERGRRQTQMGSVVLSQKREGCSLILLEQRIQKERCLFVLLVKERLLCNMRTSKKRRKH